MFFNLFNRKPLKDKYERYLFQSYLDKTITQRNFVMSLLKYRGDEGIYSFDFIKLYCPRVASIVFLFKKRGLEIKSVRQKKGGVVYIMPSDQFNCLCSNK